MASVKKLGRKTAKKYLKIAVSVLLRLFMDSKRVCNTINDPNTGFLFSDSPNYIRLSRKTRPYIHVDKCTEDKVWVTFYASSVTFEDIV